MDQAAASGQHYSLAEGYGLASLPRSGVGITYSGLQNVVLNGSNRGNTFTIDFTLVTPMTINGGSGLNTLKDAAGMSRTWYITGRDSGTVGGSVQFNSAQNSTGGRGRISSS
jgi:hypothetical protein